MIRYIKQTNDYECVVVAYINILKWANHGTRRGMPTLKSRAKYKKLLNTKTGIGNHPLDLPWQLDKEPHIDYCYMMPHIKKVERALANGNIVYVSYVFKENNGTGAHAFILTEASEDNNTFTSVNFERDKTVIVLSRKKLINILRTTDICLDIARKL